MGNKLCLNCFRLKGDYAVCPYCGYGEDAPPQAPFYLKPGTILENRYIIGEAIGCGGFGITYKAYDTALSIIVAVKEFYPAGLVNRAEESVNVSIFSGNRADEYRQMLSRFIEEAQNMALFENEKDIVNVFAYFEANGTAYIIMEYIDGILLKDYLKLHGRMEDAQACNYLCSLLAAIGKIHEKGIIHKDISPDNIFLVSPSEVKVFDFGAARLRSSESDRKLPVVVKTGYAPPEQYRSKSTPDYRADIYAAGSVMYQMLTGEKPIQSLDRMNDDVLEMPSKKGAVVRPYIEKCVMKAMSLNPEMRYASAMEFYQAIQNPVKKRGWKWWNEN